MGHCKGQGSMVNQPREQGRLHTGRSTEGRQAGRRKGRVEEQGSQVNCHNKIAAGVNDLLPSWEMGYSSRQSPLPLLLLAGKGVI